MHVQDEPWQCGGCCVASSHACLLVSRCPSPINSCVRCSWTSCSWNWEGILVVIIFVAFVIVFVAFVVFFFRPFVFPEDAGYMGSWSQPPWVWIYCPHVVDSLISRWDVLWSCLGLGFLSTEATIGGTARFFAEQAAYRATWLVEFSTVGSTGGTGKAYL